MNRKPTQQEKIAGGLVGLLVGDALGVPYEFHKASDIPSYKEIEYQPPKKFDRAHKGVPIGTWSDDGAQALCLLASLLECDSFDADDFGQRLVRWYQKGYMAVNNHVFDIGITTGEAIRAISFGTPPPEAGPTDVHSNGNGSLMRVLPLALWHRGTDRELAKDAFLQSSVTHGHPRSQICCAIYCLWARYILQDEPKAWEKAVSTLEAIWGKEHPFTQEMDYYIRPKEIATGRGSGYVVDSLRSAKMLDDLESYEKVVKGAIVLGDDTDTTACIAGGIAGIKYGINDIPPRWIDNLRGKELYELLLESLLERFE